MRNIFKLPNREKGSVNYADAKPRGIHHTVRVKEPYNDTWNHIWGQIKKIGLAEEERAFKSQVIYSYDPPVVLETTPQRIVDKQYCRSLPVEKASLLPQRRKAKVCTPEIVQALLLAEQKAEKHSTRGVESPNEDYYQIEQWVYTEPGTEESKQEQKPISYHYALEIAQEAIEESALAYTEEVNSSEPIGSRGEPWNSESLPRPSDIVVEYASVFADTDAHTTYSISAFERQEVVPEGQKTKQKVNRGTYRAKAVPWPKGKFRYKEKRKRQLASTSNKVLSHAHLFRQKPVTISKRNKLKKQSHNQLMMEAMGLTALGGQIASASPELLGVQG